VAYLLYDLSGGGGGGGGGGGRGAMLIHPFSIRGVLWHGFGGKEGHYKKNLSPSCLVRLLGRRGRMLFSLLLKERRYRSDLLIFGIQTTRKNPGRRKRRRGAFVLLNLLCEEKRIRDKR